MGVEPAYSKVRSIPVDRGRFLAEEEKSSVAALRNEKYDTDAWNKKM
jgi:hypothetical protein